MPRKKLGQGRASNEIEKKEALQKKEKKHGHQVKKPHAPSEGKWFPGGHWVKRGERRR